MSGCRDAPTISNLLFADDSLILMQADKDNAECLRRILMKYSAVSGQLISEEKSSIFSVLTQALRIER